LTNLISSFFLVFIAKMKAQDMPSHDNALKIAASLAFVTEVLGILRQEALPLAVVLAAAKLALFGLLLYFILKIHLKPERWSQTMTAIFGAQFVVNLLSLPFMSKLVAFMEEYRESIEQGSAMVNLSGALLVVAALQIWLFVLTVRILRESMEISTFRATMNTFLIIYLLTLAMSALIGAFSPSTPFTLPN
jgi:hypothetical protein